MRMSVLDIDQAASTHMDPNERDGHYYIVFTTALTHRVIADGCRAQSGPGL
jgi:hypothetical protein